MSIYALLGFFGRAAITAVVVVLASVIAEAAGQVLGALAASLPVSAGPTYVFLALSHDAAFISASALGSFAANAATIVFLATYARIAMGRSRLGALLPAVLVWLFAALLVQSVRWTPLSASALNAAVFAGGLLVTRPMLTSGRAMPPRSRATRRDLVGRALAVAVFVATVIGLSAVLGPAATGVLATFPIVFVVLIFVLRPRIGDAACAVLAATALRAMGGFGLMFLVAHFAVIPLGTTVGLLLALVPTLAWSGALAYRHSRSRKTDGRVLIPR